MRGTSSVRRWLALAVLAAALGGPAGAGAEEAAPNTGRIALSAGVDFPTHYFFRGIRQEDEDYIVQPFADITFKLHEGQGPLSALGLTVGIWNSLHGGPSGVDGAASVDPEVWYEADFYAKLAATLFQDLTAAATYTVYMSPNDRFQTVHEIALSLAYNDARLLGAFALNPNLTLAFETQGQADAGASRGVWLQAGVAPGLTLFEGAAYPVALSFPVSLALSLDDYYEFATGDDDTFGYLSVGAAASVPLAFIPRAFGSWQARASVTLLYLGDNLKAVNKGDRTEFVGSLGLALTY